MSRKARLAISLILLSGAVGCASPPPVESYTLARSALKAAKTAEAGRHAAADWYKAEEFYRKGEKAYKISDYGEAKIDFDKAKMYAERAENITRLKKFQSGEFAP
jgi:hypothetical protein